MSNILTSNHFLSLEPFQNPNNRNNLRFYDDEQRLLLKLTFSNEEYWQKIMNKKIPNFNTPLVCYSIEEEILEYANNIMFYEDYKCGVVIKFLKGYDVLHNFSFFDDEQRLLLKLIQKILYSNAMAVSNGVIHCDYTPRNIMVNTKNHLDVKIIDLDESVVDGFSCGRKYRAHNMQYLYDRDHLENERELIHCDKVSLLNMFMLLLSDGVLSSSNNCSKVNAETILYKIKSIGLPKDYQLKFQSILLNQVTPKDDDFFIDDFEQLIKYKWHM